MLLCFWFCYCVFGFFLISFAFLSHRNKVIWRQIKYKYTYVREYMVRGYNIAIVLLENCQTCLNGKLVINAIVTFDVSSFSINSIHYLQNVLIFETERDLQQHPVDYYWPEGHRSLPSHQTPSPSVQSLPAHNTQRWTVQLFQNITNSSNTKKKQCTTYNSVYSQRKKNK